MIEMFSEQLKEIREANKLSQVETAQKLGVTKQSVANWENGNIMPSIDMLVKIAKLFNITTDFLLGLDCRKFIDVTGLEQEEIAHIQAIINDIKSK